MTAGGAAAGSRRTGTGPPPRRPVFLFPGVPVVLLARNACLVLLPRPHNVLRHPMSERPGGPAWR
ncbi:hypothetical protein STXM2123_2855 [Streptomyces sp. F-3]|nr:hypothetical protein STXM2123_2855 [Streptomyces sp. F-3]